MDDGDSPKIVSQEAAMTSSVDFFSIMFPTFSLDKFEALITNYGFTDEWDKELLIARYYRNLSFRDIEREFGYVSYVTVKRRLDELHKLLIERGFKQELE